MDTIDLNAYRNELAREILSTDSIEVLQSVYRAYRHAMNKVTSQTDKRKNMEEDEFPMQCCEETVPYMTQAELDADIEAALNDENADETEVKKFYARWSNLQ